MKAFVFKGEHYIRCVPGKNLFKSTMVHEVVNRGDIFAVRVNDSCLTIIPGDSEVVHLTANVNFTQVPADQTPLEKMAEELRAAIAARNERKRAGGDKLCVGDGFRPNRWRSTGRYVVRDISFDVLWCDYYDSSREKRNRDLLPVTTADLKEGFIRVD